MEQVFYLTNIRVVSLTCRVLPTRRHRLLCELFILINSFILLAILIYLHKSYVSINSDQLNGLDILFNHFNSSNNVFLTKDSYSIVKISILPTDMYYHVMNTYNINVDVDRNQEIKVLISHTNESNINRDSLYSLYDQGSQPALLTLNNFEYDVDVIKNSYINLFQRVLRLFSFVSKKLLSSNSTYIYTMEKDLILPIKHGNYVGPVRNVTIFEMIVSKDHICLGTCLCLSLM